MLSLAPCAFSTALALALIALTRVAAFDMSRNDNVRPSLFAVFLRSVLMLMLMLLLLIT